MDDKGCSSWGSCYQVWHLKILYPFIFVAHYLSTFRLLHFCKFLIRNSDSPSLRTSMKCKDRWNRFLSSEIRVVNFVIFVVNGISVLKSMDSNDDSETKYSQTLARAFSCPYVSFKGNRILDFFPLVTFL